MLLLFIICFENVDCDIYNILYCLCIECKINLSIYLSIAFCILVILFLHLIHLSAYIDPV